MRFINCTTLQVEEFFGRDIRPYAILSHTWGDEEVSFADLPLDKPTTIARAGYRKIAFTCAQATRDGLNYAWIDTCCIDKSSSSELSEAINSMFAWYRNSHHCYVYLSDVSKASMDHSFSESRWFTRGWTLQELLAPEDVIFYDREWIELGTKSEHAEWISEITGIDATALLGPTDIDGMDIGLGSFCAAKRMSWASDRETTRAEDMAYCLLGIFGVHMPLLYGEGDRAFLRLQEEIIRKFDDDSILAWGLDPEMDHPRGLVSDTVRSEMSGIIWTSDILASSPKDFVNCANLNYAAESTSPFTLTNIGLQIQLPLVPVFQPNDPFVPDGGRGWIGLLSCSTGSSLEFVGILLCPMGRNDESSARVTRARIGTGTSCNTLVVGSRAVVRSVLETVTIIGFDESQRVRGYHWGYRQIVVNESRALQDMGYQVRNGTGWNIAEPSGKVYGYNPIWDPETMILTIEGENIFRDIIELCFEPSWSGHNTKFTIFMRTVSSRAIVREGDAFSEDDKRSFYDYLEHQSSQDDTGNVVIPDSEGNLFQVSVGIHATRVYNHRLFEVNVDAVQVVAGDI
jgi:hypothetical protein